MPGSGLAVVRIETVRSHSLVFLPFLAAAALSSIGGLLASDSRAGEDVANPKVFFRNPDPVTEKRIRDKLLGGDGIGAGTKDQRARARAELEVLDAWAVPYLANALHGRKANGPNTIRMNAVATLARILDPRALPQIRAAAVEDKDRWVRRTALLALGLFQRPEDVSLLAGRLNARRVKRRPLAAALAMGKIPDIAATQDLVARLAKPPGDEHIVAAYILAAAVRSPDAPIEKFLGDKRRLVQRVAAAALQIRPISADQAPMLIRFIERGRYREVRELQHWALGAIKERTPEIRNALLDCAVKTKYKSDTRVAALASLAYEWNVKSNYDRLHQLYRSIRARNDSVLFALMFAMARSGDEKSIDTLLRVIKTAPAQRCYYASASLFHVIALAPGKHPRAGEIAGAIARQRSRVEDPRLLRLIDLVGRWSSPPDGTPDRGAIARDGFRDIGDPKDLHLFDWTREERAWQIVNSMVPHIFELDQLLGSMSNPEGGAKPEAKPGSGKKDEAGSEEEMDLLEFLQEKPYYVPGDLGS